MSENILYANGRRVSFDVPDMALETAEELMDAGAGIDIAVTQAAPLIIAAELAAIIRDERYFDENGNFKPTQLTARIQELEAIGGAR